jgi:hypothetical protein
MRRTGGKDRKKLWKEVEGQYPVLIREAPRNDKEKRPR